MMCDPDFGINSFALVAYIPDPLGQYLDGLRQELVPGCKFHSHVTILPPRPLETPAEQALTEIQLHLEHVPPFDITIHEVEVFPRTSVIYLGLGAGREQLVRLHEAMNCAGLEFAEPFPFHPHVTLAQDFPCERLAELRQIAEHRWESWRGQSFHVDRLTFVQRLSDNTWTNLAECRLDQALVSA